MISTERSRRTPPAVRRTQLRTTAGIPSRPSVAVLVAVLLVGGCGDSVEPSSSVSASDSNVADIASPGQRSSTVPSDEVSSTADWAAPDGFAPFRSESGVEVSHFEALAGAVAGSYVVLVGDVLDVRALRVYRADDVAEDVVETTAMIVEPTHILAGDAAAAADRTLTVEFLGTTPATSDPRGEALFFLHRQGDQPVGLELGPGQEWNPNEDDEGYLKYFRLVSSQGLFVPDPETGRPFNPVTERPGTGGEAFDPLVRRLESLPDMGALVSLIESESP